jgi:CMP-N,N'-diacetyllegionaminic acid synthase
VSRVIVSTDDKAIAKVAAGFGAEVPFLRPSELSTDSSPTLLTLQHAIAFFASHGEVYDAVLSLQSTLPFVTTDTIDAAIQCFSSACADTLICVEETRAHPAWLRVMDKEGIVSPWDPDLEVPTRRQNAGSFYLTNGAVYISRVETLMTKTAENGSYSSYASNEKIVGFPVSGDLTIDIDNMDDFQRAELAMRMRRETKGPAS